jgi:hypothetical protein
MPSSPQLGEKWIVQSGGIYQAYTWLNDWIIFAGGGTVITESTNEIHYMNVIVQESQPDSIIKPGWSWIKQSLLQEYLCLGKTDDTTPIYVLIAGG